MRFFLALWVVVYHQVPSVDSLPRVLPTLQHLIECVLHIGYAAVGFFFILSGFVLAYNYDLYKLTVLPELKRFAVARFSRIYPAYFIALLLLVPLFAYKTYLESDTFESALTTFLLNITLLQAWLPDTALTWNFPGWSLSNEAFFYACFPFLGALLWKAEKLRTIFTLGLVLWAFSLTAPLIAVLIPIHGFGDVPATQFQLVTQSAFWTNVIRFNPLIRLPEFCVGILLARLFRRVPNQHWLWKRGNRLYLPAGAAALFLFISSRHIPYPLMHNSLLLPLYACIVFGFALEGGILAQWLSKPALGFLGNASYSMYILHAPIYIWSALAFRYILNREPLGGIWLVASTALVVFGSCIFFWAAEDPLHRMLRNKLSGNHSPKKSSAYPSAKLGQIL